MADIVNLRAARKAQARASAATQADINRAAFGRTKAEKQKPTWRPIGSRSGSTARSWKETNLTPGPAHAMRPGPWTSGALTPT